MQLIQEYVKDNDDYHMDERSYGFRIIKPKDPFEDWKYDFSTEYDIMIIKKLPKGFKETKEY